MTPRLALALGLVLACAVAGVASCVDPINLEDCAGPFVVESSLPITSVADSVLVTTPLPEGYDCADYVVLGPGGERRGTFQVRVLSRSRSWF